MLLSDFLIAMSAKSAFALMDRPIMVKILIWELLPFLFIKKNC